MNPTIVKLRAKIAEKRSAAQSIVDSLADSEITRDMNEAEKASFDELMAAVTTLKNQVTQLQAMDDDAAADETAVADEIERSRAIPRRSTPIGHAPAIHTEKRKYSILRAISCVANNRPVDGLEGEISREISRRIGKAPKGAFFMPTGCDPEITWLANGGADPIRRDLTTTTGGGSVFTAAELPFIELLRAKLVIQKLGVQFLTEMKGNFAIPRQTGSSTVQWLGEGVVANPTNQTLDQVLFSPKVAIAGTNVSRQFMNQTSLEAESFVKLDLAETMARELDRVCFNGTGTTQPLGIFQTPAIQTLSSGVAIGPNGGPATFATVVGMEGQVASYNADTGRLAYVTNPGQRAKLKQAPKIQTGQSYPEFIWSGTDTDKGEVNGYPAFVTSNVPNNITKGTGTNLSGIAFGNWNDAIFAQWEGMDMIINPYTNQFAGAVAISMEASVDFEVRHYQSFSVVTDAQ